MSTSMTSRIRQRRNEACYRAFGLSCHEDCRCRSPCGLFRPRPSPLGKKTMQRGLPIRLVFLVGLVVRGIAADHAYAVEPARVVLRVGGDKQLFVDEVLFDRKERVGLVVNPPIKDPRPVLMADKSRPWELNRVSSGNSVIDDAGVV